MLGEYAKNAVIESRRRRSPVPVTQHLAARDRARELWKRRRHAAVVYKIRLGGGAPTLGAAIAVPGGDDPSQLFDAIERAGEAVVEGVLVEAIERAASRAT